MPNFLSPRTPHDIEQRPASPNYFGLIVESNDSSMRNASSTARGTWSPANSAVRSTAASSPHTIPINTNPQYDAFRRQAEKRHFVLNRKSSSSSSSNFRSECSPSPPPPPPGKQEHDRRHNRPGPASPRANAKPMSILDHKADSVAEGELLMHSRSPKRVLPDDAGGFTPSSQRGTAASFYHAAMTSASGSPPQRQHDEKHPRLSMSHTPKQLPHAAALHSRAVTLPSNLEVEGPTMVAPQKIVNIIESSGEDVLILDLRVATQYARSRVSGALNLCIPSTLLKRPSYNVSKLADTFKAGEQREKFEHWQASKCIVAYDTNSNHLKEAAGCANILKKFTNEGWRGQSLIVKGGFDQLAKTFPRLVDEGSVASLESGSSTLFPVSDQYVPPVVGGCPMPATKNAANPFFGNIRQNMDLICGVGQMPVQKPAALDKQTQIELPLWLKKSTDEGNNGKEVSDKFLHIEKREQKRMQAALSGHVAYGSNSQSDSDKLQIAGIEKGVKNRYNNIWPYDHTRVKLQDVPANDCDYVNASFISTSVSKKTYIATQAPIPATFVDFWNMVWQRDIRVIVMLTADTEGGQVKAHNYWDNKQYGPVKLNFHSEHRASLELDRVVRRNKRPDNVRRTSSHLDMMKSNDSIENPESSGGKSPSSSQPHVMVRKFTVSHDGYPWERMREITQLQYSSWPDFGAPAHPAHLLGLVEQCNNVVRSFASSDRHSPSVNRPVLVHCSAGCGRTGTFCTVDTVVDVLRQQRIKKSASRHENRMDIDSSAESKKEKIAAEAGGPTNSGSDSFFNSKPEVAPSAETRDDSADDVDLIEKVVEEFRLQRLSMVQSLRQFVLCYESILEWLVEQNQPKTA